MRYQRSCKKGAGFAEKRCVVLRHHIAHVPWTQAAEAKEAIRRRKNRGRKKGKAPPVPKLQRLITATLGATAVFMSDALLKRLKRRDESEASRCAEGGRDLALADARGGS